MFTLPDKFVFPCIFKSEWSFVGNYVVPKTISHVVYKRIFPSKTSRSNNTGICTCTMARSTGTSRVYTGIGSIRLTIPLDPTDVLPNLKSRSHLLLG